MKIAKEKTYDVFVAGAGVAGVAAALQAARQGKKVALAEKCATLGGMATTGHVNLFEPMCNGRGVQIMKGMAAGLLEMAIRYGYDDVPEDWKNGEPGYGTTNKRFVCHFSACIFALALMEALDQAGVDVMFDTVVTDVEATGQHINSVLIFNKSGYSRIHAKMFVDTTGDSDLLYALGVPTVTQGGHHTYAGWGLNLESCKRAVEAGTVEKVCFDMVGGNASWNGRNHPEGMPLWDGTDGDQVSAYFKTNQLELLDNIRHDDRHSREVVMLPAMHQIRTTRRIDGNYTLNYERDVYRHFADSVGAVCDPMKRDQLFEVPFGTLVRDGFDNIITAGRSASGEGLAWNVLRVIPQAILTGQAAGAACALAIEEGCAVTHISIQSLQQVMEKAGNSVHFDDALVPAN
jgi:hypothetical protein